MQPLAKIVVSSIALIALSVGFRVLPTNDPLLLAKGVGPDFAGSKSEGWWAVNGVLTFVPGAYEDKGLVYFTRLDVMKYAATTELEDDHVRTSTGMNLPHQHYDQEFSGDDKALVNLWFDHLFGAVDSPPKTERHSSASTKHNCHSHAFGTLGRGTYSYWMVGYDAIYKHAVSAECNPVPKGSVGSGDLLMYHGKDHTTVVHEAASYKTTELRWKAGFSGVYGRTNAGGSFDTGRYDPSPFPAVGAAFDSTTWKWEPSAVGKASELWGGQTKDGKDQKLGEFVLRKK